MTESLGRYLWPTLLLRKRTAYGLLSPSGVRSTPSRAWISSAACSLALSRSAARPGAGRTYAEKGRGFALGFVPKVFDVVDGAGLNANEISFVGPVVYDGEEIFARHKRAIVTAASIFLAAAEAHAGLMADKRVGIPFMRRMADELIASPLIWNARWKKLLRKQGTATISSTGELSRREIDESPFVFKGVLDRRECGCSRAWQATNPD